MKLSEKGMGLLEVLIGAAIMGALSVLLMKMNESGQQGLTRVEKSLSANDLDRELNQAISTKQNCMLTFGNTRVLGDITGTNKVAVTVFRKTDKNGTPVDAYPVPVSRDLVTLVSASFGNYNSAKETADLIKTYKYKLSPTNEVIKTLKSSFVISYNGPNTATSTITGCALTSSNVSGPWLVNGNNIFYEAGNVGIGTTMGNPATKLDVRDTTELDARFTTYASTGPGTTVSALRARGTQADPTGVLTGDRLGGFLMGGLLSGTFYHGAGIEGYAENNWGGAPGYREASLRFYTSGQLSPLRETMRLSPLGHLSLGPNGNGTSQLTLGRSAGGVSDSFSMFEVRADDLWNLKLFQIKNSPAYNYAFKQTYNGTVYDVLAFTQGNVGIGTTAPTAKLHVIGNILASGTITPSDKRLKKNIRPIEDSLKKILSLNGVSYNWNEPEKHGEERQLGVIAQDVRKKFPEVVKKNPDGFLAVSYQSLIAPLIEAIKELHRMDQEKFKELESENTDLKARLDKIEKQLQIKSSGPDRY